MPSQSSDYQSYVKLSEREEGKSGLGENNRNCFAGVLLTNTTFTAFAHQIGMR